MGRGCRCPAKRAAAVTLQSFEQSRAGARVWLAIVSPRVRATLMTRLLCMPCSPCRRPQRLLRLRWQRGRRQCRHPLLLLVFTVFLPGLHASLHRHTHLCPRCLGRRGEGLWQALDLWLPLLLRPLVRLPPL